MGAMSPVAMAVQGKGIFGMVKRAQTITSRYGLTPVKMDQILGAFVDVLRRFDAPATFPITAIALARSKGVVEKYQPDNIEFAVHGYYHVDHSRLSLEEQRAQLAKTRRIFQARGITPTGFRSPYLRWSKDTIAAVAQNGFLYDSSQGLVWDVVTGLETESYHQVLQFYRSVAANSYPALPKLEGPLVRIPYCLPDDESLIDRLRLDPDHFSPNPWLAILSETHRKGELFTLGLHPERIHLLKGWLSETLQRARSLSPSVWMTRLDEVARWWRERSTAEVTVTQSDDRIFQLEVTGPQGLTILAREVKLRSPAHLWDGEYWLCEGLRVEFEADRRPFIGVSPQSSPHLTTFLRQVGYIVEDAREASSHAMYLDLPSFKAEDERSLLRHIEDSRLPLVRLGRWPNGAKSALVVTGDVDALTIWDYGLRLFGI
jgi:peptidoglycan/xylan/chitin deacetylase (PgdA/CDA1 family)